MTESELLSFDELRRRLKRVDAGDPDALASVFSHFSDRLGRIIKSRLNARVQSRVGVGDILQETFLEAQKRLREYLRDPSMAFFLWLRLIAIQKVLETHRRHLDAKKRDARREVRGRDAAIFGSSSSAAALSDLIVAEQSTPSANAAQAELREQLARALEELDPVDREIIFLRHFEALSNIECAEVLGIQANTSAQRHLRALKRLKEILERFSGLKDFLVH
jgi:RNA polymerase sigma-70 factor (ECF subfamily)